ncbi:hypothetical protein VNO77_03300 [Canavalia gladiata]|uniref:Uncharacterized protein n=1 Tax=Canavalia gladiata TaxID=3824 RepID=A0AAN9MZM0_CANGL
MLRKDFLKDFLHEYRRSERRNSQKGLVARQDQGLGGELVISISWRKKKKRAFVALCKPLGSEGMLSISWVGPSHVNNTLHSTNEYLNGI